MRRGSMGPPLQSSDPTDERTTRESPEYPWGWTWNSTDIEWPVRSSVFGGNKACTNVQVVDPVSKVNLMLFGDLSPLPIPHLMWIAQTQCWAR